MAYEKKRQITVNKLFAPVIQQGEHKGKQVIITPSAPEMAEFLTDEQLEAYVASGSVSVENIEVDTDQQTVGLTPSVMTGTASTTRERRPATPVSRSTNEA